MESAENSEIRIDIDKVEKRLKMGEMSDAGKLCLKLNTLKEVISKSIYISLKAFKATTLSLKQDAAQALKHSELLPGCKSVLANLFAQNLRTDSKIFIMGHANLGQQDPGTCEKVLDTLDFCCRFKQIVGPLLAELDKKRQEEAEDGSSEEVEDMRSVLHDLKKPEDEKKEDPSPRKPVPLLHVSKVQKEMPSELLSKLAELVEGTSQPATGREELPLPEAMLSNINKSQKPDSYLTSFFEGEEENALFKNIRSSKNQINEQIKAVLQPVSAIKIDEFVQESESVEKAVEGQNTQIKMIAFKLTTESMNYTKEFCHRFTRNSLPVRKTHKKDRQSAGNRACVRNVAGSRTRSLIFVTPLMKHLFTMCSSLSISLWKERGANKMRGSGSWNLLGKRYRKAAIEAELWKK